MTLIEIAWQYLVGTFAGVGFCIGQFVSGTFVGGLVGSWAGVTVALVFLVVISLPFNRDRSDLPDANQPETTNQQNSTEP